MKGYLLDTSICIFLFRNKYDIGKRLNELDVNECYISEVTVAELKYGVENSKQREIESQKLDRFLKRINIVPFCESIDLYAKEKARLRKEGFLIDDFDLLIGCAALSRDLIMVTDNEKHFARILHLRIENWVNREG